MPDHLLPSDDEDIDSLMIKALIEAGVDEKRARAQTKTCTHNDETLFMDICGRGAISSEANGHRQSLNVKGLGALDIHTLKPNGDEWDFTKRANRREVRELVNRLDPDCIDRLPPCKPCCLWNSNLNVKRMEKTSVARMVAEGREQLNFMAWMYKRQMVNGKLFLHEQLAKRSLGTRSRSRTSSCIKQ